MFEGGIISLGGRKDRYSKNYDPQKSPQKLLGGGKICLVEDKWGGNFYVLVVCENFQNSSKFIEIVPTHIR